MAKAVEDWADEEKPADVGRRRFLTATLIAGGAGLVGTLVASAASIVPPPFVFRGTIEETFLKERGGRVRISDFKLWDGVVAVWRQGFDEEGEAIPFTGLPALVICVEERLLQVPPAEIFEGRTMADFVIHTRAPRPDTGQLVDGAIVALYDRCVHFCCRPSWHQAPVNEAYKGEWPIPPRTLEAVIGAQDPIQCLCHFSMYDPVTLVSNVHPPPKAVPYVGARHVHGPATRALPCIPLRASGDSLIGIYEPEEGGHPEWYSAYCQ